MLIPQNTLAKQNGYAVVEEIGGHGVGLAFHEEPYVCHVGKKDTGMLLVPGMVFTIEPMINAGNFVNNSSKVPKKEKKIFI